MSCFHAGGSENSKDIFTSCHAQRKMSGFCSFFKYLPMVGHGGGGREKPFTVFFNEVCGAYMPNFGLGISRHLE